MLKNKKPVKEKVDPVKRGKARIGIGLLFAAFALWLFFSTKNYASLKYDLVSSSMQISEGDFLVELNESESKKLSTRMQNNLRIKEIEAQDFPVTIDLKNGTILFLNLETRQGKVESKGSSDGLEVGNRLANEINAYLKEKP